MQRALPGSSPDILRPPAAQRCVPSPPCPQRLSLRGTSSGGLESTGPASRSSGEGAGLPGLLPWGWLENKLAGSLTSGCGSKPVGVDGEAALGGRWRVVVKALAGGGAQGDTGKEVVMGICYPSRLLSQSSSQAIPHRLGPGRQIPAPLVPSEHLAQGMRLGLPIPRSHSGVGGQAEGCGCRGLGPASHTAHGIEPVLQRSEVCKWEWGRCWAWGGGCPLLPLGPQVPIPHVLLLLLSRPPDPHRHHGIPRASSPMWRG